MENLSTKTKILAGAIVATIILGIILFNMLVGHKNSTELIIKQSPFGTMSCVEGQGWYLKGFADIYTYERAKAFYFNSSTEKVRGEGWEGDDTDEDDVDVTLSRNAGASMSGYVLYELPTECDKLLALHRIYGSSKNIKHNLVRNEVLSAVRKTAPLYTAEEAKVTKFAEMNRMFNDQVVEGEYLTQTNVIKEPTGPDELDSNGKVIKKAEYQEYTITKLKLDSLGHRIILKPSALTKAGIQITQCVIQKVKLDKIAQDQLDVVKKREMERVSKATEAEAAKQEAITARENGKADVAREQAAQLVEKIKATTIAEKEKEVAVLEAQKDFEVAQYEAKKANEVAKKIKAEKEAEAAANMALVRAGLTPQERAEWEYKTKVGVAEALAKSAQPLVPEIMMSGDSKGGAGTAMDAVGLNMLMDLTNKLSAK
jgi:regulator of protease activity HflC (stomatin/prohibitin superfamily)